MNTGRGFLVSSKECKSAVHDHFFWLQPPLLLIKWNRMLGSQFTVRHFGNQAYNILQQTSTLPWKITIRLEKAWELWMTSCSPSAIPMETPFRREHLQPMAGNHMSLQAFYADGSNSVGPLRDQGGYVLLIKHVFLFTVVLHRFTIYLFLVFLFFVIKEPSGFEQNETAVLPKTTTGCRYRYLGSTPKCGRRNCFRWEANFCISKHVAFDEKTVDSTQKVDIVWPKWWFWLWIWWST